MRKQNSSDILHKNYIFLWDCQSFTCGKGCSRGILIWYDYSVKSTNPRHACMSVDEGLYDTPHNEDEVGRRPMKIRIVGRIVGAACSETIRNLF